MKLRNMSSLREKKRYIAFKLHSDSQGNYNDMRNAVWSSVLGFLGDDDTARANVQIIKNTWNQKQQTGLIKCSHLYVDKIKMSLALIHQVGDSKVIFQTTRVSGTIKGTSTQSK